MIYLIFGLYSLIFSLCVFLISRRTSRRLFRHVYKHEWGTKESCASSRGSQALRGISYFCFSSRGSFAGFAESGRNFSGGLSEVVIVVRNEWRRTFSLFIGSIFIKELDSGGKANGLSGSRIDWNVSDLFVFVWLFSWYCFIYTERCCEEKYWKWMTISWLFVGTVLIRKRISWV